MFQSRDWVDVYSGSLVNLYAFRGIFGFNPATGLMFIPATITIEQQEAQGYRFNPATGLMFIPAYPAHLTAHPQDGFQSRDWVDVYSGHDLEDERKAICKFQSRDWVDVYSGSNTQHAKQTLAGFNPATGLMFIPAIRPFCEVSMKEVFQSRDWVDVYSGA